MLFFDMGVFVVDCLIEFGDGVGVGRPCDVYFLTIGYFNGETPASSSESQYEMEGAFCLNVVVC